MSLKINSLSVSRDSKKILRSLNLEIKPGEVHVLMGPNGSGKSTLAYTLMGNPSCSVLSGSIDINGVKTSTLTPDNISKQGMFLAFQHPIEVPGVNMRSFLRLAYKSHGKDIKEFNKKLLAALSLLKTDPKILERNLNENFSGGERKKGEILQMLLLQPKYAVLDEIDSGLDVSALKSVANAINICIKKDPALGLLIITHYSRILDYITEDIIVHVMKEGEIVKSGTRSLIGQVEAKGYEEF